MADREKLIEICRRYDGTPPCDTCKKPIGNCSMCGLERLIDYLISEGVTVRERGRWEYHGGDDDMNLYGFCSKCHANWDEDIMEKFNFCPNCGADMRGEEDGKL